MKYYGQDEIDKYLVEHLILPDKGVFVDVGAGPDGLNMSNSKVFEDKGWKVLCIDGDSRNTALKKNRKLVELTVVSSKPELTFYESKVSPDISGAIKYNDDVVEKKVKAVTLESLLTKHKIDKIDILSIDTEGTEIEVFETMDPKHKPRYLVIEFDSQGNVNLEVEPYFTSKGYKVAGVVGPNMIFELPQPIVKDPHLMVYGSSYDRGLDMLLKMWPDIRKAVPDARLRVFYGWNLFDVAFGDNPERKDWKEKMNKLMEQDGITHLGRIGHEAVLKEFERAGVWAYPTYFGEISCITAMKAQAMGAVPCVINYAALKETVQFGVKVDGDIYDKETQDLYKGSLIALLNDPKYQEDVRKEMVPWAKEHFAWSNVAKQWDEEFRKEISPEEKAMQLILADEPIEALRLLNTTSPLRDKLVKKLDHMFNPEKYKEKYADGPMDNKHANVAFDRHNWILEEAKDAKTLIDLGCYSGLLVDRFGEGALGVEMCKAAASKEKNIITGDALTYQDGKKYDAVVACELIEHVPDPKVLIDNMLSLVSEDGWCYVTTPNGCYDAEAAKKVWETPNALIDHVRTYNKEKMEAQLAGCDVLIKIDGKELYAKFRRNIDKQVEELLEDNQALKAWDVVKDTNHPLKDKVWPLVKHAFDPVAYKKYYSEDLIETPVPEEMALDCTKLYPRFKWLVDSIEKQKPDEVLDLGCADGYLCLTLAKRGIRSYGVNLYKPSIEHATMLAEKYKLTAGFEVNDLMDIKGKYEVVVLSEVLEHVPNPQETIDHCMSLVNKIGSFYLTTPSPDHLGIKLHKEEMHGSNFDGKPSGHLQIFTEAELREMLGKYKIEQLLVDEQGCFLIEVRHND